MFKRRGRPLIAIIPICALLLAACQGLPLAGQADDPTIAPADPTENTESLDPKPVEPTEPPALEQAGNDTLLFSFVDGYQGSATVFWYKLHDITDSTSYPSICGTVPDFGRYTVQGIRVDITVNYETTNGFTLPEQRRLEAFVTGHDGRAGGAVERVCGDLVFPVAETGQTHQIWLTFLSERNPNQPDGTPLDEAEASQLELQFTLQDATSTYPG